MKRFSFTVGEHGQVDIDDPEQLRALVVALRELEGRSPAFARLLRAAEAHQRASMEVVAGGS